MANFDTLDSSTQLEECMSQAFSTEIGDELSTAPSTFCSKFFSFSKHSSTPSRTRPREVLEPTESTASMPTREEQAAK